METTTSPPRAAVSNAELGRLLNCNFSTTSRLRAGLRNPSIAMINKIKKITGWKTDAQIKSVDAGTFGVDFEVALVRKFGAEESDGN